MTRLQTVRVALDNIVEARDHLEIAIGFRFAGQETERIDDMLYRLQRAKHRINSAVDHLVQAGGKAGT